VGRNSEYIRQACEFLPTASYKQALAVYEAMLTDPNLDDEVVAAVGREDRYFLLTNILRVRIAYHPWLYERCREVEAEPDGCIDLWAREHFKSTIITFAGSFQEIIKDREITIGIFSFNKSIARDFVRNIKQEMEDNPNLPRYYPDIFWQNPQKESPLWSRDGGLIVKRERNPKEATISGWGLVDGQPTSKHFVLMIYDDVVTDKSVTIDMIPKTTEAWELSRSLTSRQEDGSEPRTWYIGTRYNYADTYQVIMARKAAKPRIYPATDDGTPDGKPVFLNQREWDTKKRETIGKTLACQQLQNPLAGDEQEFKIEWVRWYEVRPETLNVAILVDPANSKNKGTSNSAFAVIGLDGNRNKYLLDGVCHKLNLTERWTMLKRLRTKWLSQPGVQVVKVGYEKYGMQADIEHFTEMMRIESCPFPIEEVSWTRDDTSSKDDRIRRLIPDHQNWRFFYPYDGVKTSTQRAAEERGKSYLIARPIKRKDENGRVYDLVKKMMQNEYLFFPATTMKDFMDAMSRFYDLDMHPPQIVRDEDLVPEYMGDM
jgi:hypothetical protein